MRFIIVLLLLVSFPVASEPLLVAFGKNKPPFVNSDCNDGIEIRLAREIFSRAGFTELKFICVSNKRLNKLYKAGDVDISATVPKDSGGAFFYSSAFSGFENFAISRKEEGLIINSIDDLAGKSVVAWNNASTVLGSKFEEIMSKNNMYFEPNNQRSQAKMFLLERAQVIVIDKNIFRYLSKGMGFKDSDFTYHSIFPRTLDYYLGFSDELLRDKVENALNDIRLDGTYKSILRSYFE